MRLLDALTRLAARYGGLLLVIPATLTTVIGLVLAATGYPAFLGTQFDLLTHPVQRLVAAVVLTLLIALTMRHPDTWGPMLATFYYTLVVLDALLPPGPPAPRAALSISFYLIYFLIDYRMRLARRVREQEARTALALQLATLLADADARARESESP